MKNKNKKKIICIISMSLTIVLLLCLILVIYPRITSTTDIETKFYSYSLNMRSDTSTNQIFKDYDTYKNYMEENNLKIDLEEEDFSIFSYALVYIDYNSCGETITGVKVLKNTKSKITIEVSIDDDCGYCANITNAYLIPINIDTNSNANIKIKYDINYIDDCDGAVAKKPIIYLYPESETNVSVKLGHSENITVSYPKYADGWDVIAYPDGTLIDRKTNKKYYALYWEGTNNFKSNYKEGFVVSKNDISEFLEEKLEILGLNYKEREEFIVYWLPELIKNDYNYIYFMTSSEIDNEMPLDITPEPTSVIRIWMAYKSVSSDYKVVEEELISPVREGFTVVEWGGTKIK